MREELHRAHRLMRRQHGVAHRRQLLDDLGISRAVVDGQVRRGRWEVVAPGVLRAAGGAAPPAQQHAVAVLRCGPDARLTGRSVLALLGVEGFSLEALPVVVVGRDTWIDTREFRVHRIGVPPSTDWAVICGLPGVTPVRALLDHARVARGRNLRVAVDAARRAGLVTPQRLLDRALAAGRAHGARRVVRAVLSGTFAHESEGERAMAALFFDFDPPLAFNEWVLPGIRVDAVWWDARLVLEYDGRAHHTLPTDVERDAVRDARLRAAGFEVVRIRAEDLRDPVALRRRILIIRAKRLAELGVCQ